MRPVAFAKYLTAAALICAGPATADEMWTSALGPIIWESTLDDIAVLRLDDRSNGQVVHLYVPGLASDVMGGRGSYQGYWLADGGDPVDRCATQLVAPDGAKSHYWGQFTITFVRTEFPSDWAGVAGACFDTPSVALSGEVQ